MGLRVETTFCVNDEKTRKELWEGYIEAHSDSDELAIQIQQCFDETSFDAAMLDTDFVKFVLFEGEQAVGMVGGTNNLEKARIAYVNHRRLLSVWPRAREGKLWYMPLLFVRKAWQGKNCTDLLFEEVTRFFIERDADIASDFASDKHPRFLEFHDKVIGRAIEDLAKNGRLPAPVTSVENTVLGGQVYFITRFKRG